VQLDRVTVVLRPRAGWEALDLGFRLAATWWKPIFGTWLLVFLPAALALHATFPGHPFIAVLVLWWLKPVFDRFVLHQVSRRVFGEAPSPLESLAAWRSVLTSGLLAQLTWRRLDPLRSFHMPVVQLERQRGKPARARRALLARRLGGPAFALTFACANFEIVCQFGLDFLTSALLQPGPDPFSGPNAWTPEAFDEWWRLSDSAWYVLAVCAIEPFYVAAGFALYLNRRVGLEGWDVELALRRLGTRLAGVAGMLVLGLALVGMALLPAPAVAADAGTRAVPGCAPRADRPAGHPAHAIAVQAGPDEDASVIDGDEEALPETDEDEGEEPDEVPACVPGTAAVTEKPPPPLDTAARRAVLGVLDDPVFGSKRTVEHWRPRAKLDPQRRDGATWMIELARFFADVLRGLGWVAIVLIVAALVLAIARQVSRMNRPPPGAEAPPAELFGLAIAPGSLPDDIAAAALAELDRGRVREALSLVYRGALSHLVHGLGLRVTAGATEHDVGRDAAGALPRAAAEYFSALIGQWVLAAYAGRLPDVDQVRALCLAYDRHFRGSASPAGAPSAVPA